MPKYKCINKECRAFDKISESIPVHNKYTLNGVIDLNIECAWCSKDRIIIEENKGLCTSMFGSDNICKR